MLSAPKHADMHDDEPHHMMGIVGVRGGVGASLVATSLAWAISEQGDRQTALLDLDVHFGTGDRKSTRLNSSHNCATRKPSSVCNTNENTTRTHITDTIAK